MHTYLEVSLFKVNGAYSQVSVCRIAAGVRDGSSDGLVQLVSMGAFSQTVSVSSLPKIRTVGQAKVPYITVAVYIGPLCILVNKEKTSSCIAHV